MIPLVSGRSIASAAGVAGLLAVLGSAVLGSAALGAQEVEPIRLPRAGDAGSAPCAAVQPRPRRAGADTSAARRLAESGADAALLGDLRVARDRVEQAAVLNPDADDITYQLARLHEEAGDAAAARVELCRYLALAPTAADSADATRRLTALGGDATPRSPNESADVQFRTGVAYAARREYPAAAGSFAAAAVAAPDWADAHIGHAAALVARGDHAAALAPLRRAAELRTDPAERSMLHRQLRVLDRARLSPGAAFGLGLIPGGGQFYTGRPVFGAVIIAGAAGGGVLAMQSEETTRTFIGIDANGFEYEYTLPVRVYENRALGIAIAAGATVLGALEALGYAARAQRAASRLTRGTAAALGGPAGASLVPWSSGRELGIAVRLAW